jgi:hypothetical protein
MLVLFGQFPETMDIGEERDAIAIKFSAAMVLVTVHDAAGQVG